MIWIPALLTSTSIRPKASTTAAMPESTSDSLVTSMASAQAAGTGTAQLVGGGGVAIGDRHRLSKGSGNFLADAAGGTSDDGDFVSQLH